MYNNLQNSQREGEKGGERDGQREGKREGENKPKKKSFIVTLREFLDNKTGTILSVAIATAIAFAFKDLVLSIATNIVHPLFIKLISLIGLNKYINLGDNISYNVVKNFMNFIMSSHIFLKYLLLNSNFLISLIFKYFIN